jgi:Family of unknown function (DUF6166)
MNSKESKQQRKTYTGKRVQEPGGGIEGCEVYVQGEDGKSYPLPLHLEIRNHSPTGFGWGYRGSGPAQLALALLADHLGPLPAPERCPYCSSAMDGWRCTEEACAYHGETDGKWANIQGKYVHYQDFKDAIVARLRGDWSLTSENIEAWITANKRTVGKESAA